MNNFNYNDKNTLYPCVIVDGICHVMTDGTTCACGKKHDYVSEPVTEDTLVVESPIRWYPLSAVTCKICYAKHDDDQIFLNKARNH